MGERRVALLDLRDPFHPDISRTSSSLRVDEHSQRRRSSPRFQAALSEFQFLGCPRGHLLPLFWLRRLDLSQTFRCAGQGWHPGKDVADAEARLCFSAALRTLFDLRRL